MLSSFERLGEACCGCGHRNSQVRLRPGVRPMGACQGISRRRGDLRAGGHAVCCKLGACVAKSPPLSPRAAGRQQLLRGDHTGPSPLLSSGEAHHHQPVRAHRLNSRIALQSNRTNTAPSDSPGCACDPLPHYHAKNAWERHPALECVHRMHERTHCMPLRLKLLLPPLS